MEQLAKEQKKSGQDIQDLLKNYKKTAIPRRTQKYVQNQLGKLEDIYNEFCRREEQIGDLREVNKDHIYFQTEYFGKITEVYRHAKAIFAAKMEELEDSTNIDGQDDKTDGESTMSRPSDKRSPEQQKRLRKQKDNISSLVRVVQSIEEESSEQKSRAYYEVKYQILEKHWERIVVIHDEIMDNLCDIDKECEYCKDGIYSATEGQYLNALIFLRDKLDRIGEARVETESNISRPKVKLPQINIPQFDGNYLKWKSFHDLFTQIIHNQSSFGKSQKMYYLKSYIIGEPKNLIQHLQTTEENYDAAWEILCHRYNNTRLLVANQLRNLLSQPNLESESTEGIKKLHDITKECLLALNNLKVDTSSWDPILLHILTEKLDKETHRMYEQQIKMPRELQKLDEFFVFLEGRFQALESISSKAKSRTPFLFQNKNKSFRHNFKVEKNQNIKTFLTTNKPCCYKCQKDHKLSECKEFTSMAVDKRLELVKKLNVCGNCLKQGHKTSECKNWKKCRVCFSRHNTLLHSHDKSYQGKRQETQNIKTNEESKEIQVPASSNQAKAISTFHSAEESEVLLATAIIEVASKNNEFGTLRALIDQGSQSSFITEDAVQRLKLKKSRIYAEISGIGGAKAGSTTRSVQLHIRSKYDPSFKVSTNAYVLRTLTNMIPSKPIINGKWEHLQQLELADPLYDKPKTVDIILGGEVYGEIILDGVIKGSAGTPIAQLTKFGWIISGNTKQHTTSKNNIICLITQDEINNQLRKFWEIESVEFEPPLTKEEKDCEELYSKTTRRNQNGRYIVRLPLHEKINKLGKSKERATARLLQMEKRFLMNKALAKEYKAFMQEYLDLGHMQPVDKRKDNNQERTFYLPHHAVFKDSSTTKLRVVFDASMKTSTGVSLNDILMTGPTIQQDITTVLLRWRKHRIAFTADIEKMYRQILIHKDDQGLQRILWRENANEPIKEYQLTTITYGTRPAPFLALRTLNQLAEDEKFTYPLASEIVLNDFYVDDLMTGSNSFIEAVQIQEQLIALLEKGGFKLRKWVSNSARLMEKIPENLRSTEYIFNNDENTIKALGIRWCPTRDTFNFNINISKSSKTTKRSILSEASSIFDPLGWFAPVTVTAKILIQEMWLAGVSWDEKLPEELEAKWKHFKDTLPSLEEIKIKRWINYTTNTSLFELHGFCDASEQAYAAVVYSRVQTISGVIQTTLLAAKTKVAPISQKLSLPRLELCGAVLLAKLIKKIQDAIAIDSTNIKVWTDSTIVLAWLKGHPSRWKTFVANRVSEINSIINPDQWHHVRSHDNPADCASRGLLANKLRTHDLWWHGPKWLIEQNVSYPNQQTLDTDQERKIIVNVAVTNQNFPNDLLTRYSNLNKLTRVTAWLQRFSANIKLARDVRKKGPLDTQDIRKATITIIKLAQNSEFKAEIKQLEDNMQVNKSSKLLPLSPFLDANGLIRVGGRLDNSALSYDQKHPIILPHKSPLTSLVIQDAHIKTLHGGSTLTSSNIRKKYWIISGLKTVKHHIYKCITCYRYKAKATSQLMGNLPEPRLSITRPFSHTGVDYAGPFDVRMSKGRGSKSYKAYIAIFICLSTKAIHIEAVSDLTAQAFIAAFTRFTSRRGHIAHLYSDNGTNFVLANKILKINSKRQQQQYHSKICNELSKNGTEWHFIPPATPHFGGLWEAGVKSIKYHFKRIIKNTKLTFEEVATLLTQIEACLNSRPLCPLTENPEDLSVLTPGHFLIGDALLAPPQQNWLQENTHPINRWEQIQKMQQHFWSKWCKEYLSRLQERPKWNKRNTNLAVGQLVLIKDEQLPPSKWALCRITETQPGTDGLVRVVTLTNGTKTFQRPISKICALPLERNESSMSDNIRPAGKKVISLQCYRERLKNKETADTSRERHSSSEGFSSCGGGRSALQKVVVNTPQSSKECRRKTSESRKRASSNNVIQSESKRKVRIRPVTGYSSLITTFILLCLFGLGLCSYTITYPESGIYIEHMGEAKLKRGVLRLEIIYPTNTTKDIQRVNQITNEMNNLCQQSQTVSHDINCDMLIRDLEETRETILKDIDIIQFHQTHNRKKRGIFGSLLQSIFGVNDEVYTNIDELKRNQQLLVQTSHQQNNLILSMIAYFNTTELTVVNKLQQLTNKLKKALTVINDMTPWFAVIDSNRINIHILAAHQVAASILNDIAQHYTLLIGGLLQRRSMLDILSAKELQNIIKTAEGKLASNLNLYQHPEDHIQIIVNNTYIGAYGFLHIVESNEFTVFKPTSIPKRMNNGTYITADISNKVLCVNYNTQMYFELTENEFATCLQPTRYKFLCTSTVINSIETTPNCIIDEIYNRHIKHPCPVAIITLPNTMWKHLCKTNTWLFLSNQPTTAAVICNGLREDVLLNGTGIMHIDQECFIKTSKNVIKAEILNKTPVKGTFVKQAIFNLTNIGDLHQPHTSILTDDLEPVLKVSDEFSIINKHAIMNEENYHWSTMVHHSSPILIWAILISVAIVIIIIWELKPWIKKFMPTRALRPQDFKVEPVIATSVTGGENVAAAIYASPH